MSGGSTLSFVIPKWMGSATESPLGRRQYHPIYEACARHNLPLALHLGGEGAGRLGDAAGLLDSLVLAPEFVPFLTTGAYDLLP